MKAFDSFFFASLIPALILLADLCIRIGLSLRVVMQKRSYSITMAWLLIIVFLPFLGYLLYMLFGENRLPEWRLKRMRQSRDLYLSAPETLLAYVEDWHGGNLLYSSLHRLAQQTFGMPALRDNTLQLLTKPADFFRALIHDIDQAETSCYLQFYIWSTGGEADAVGDALIRAASRGVDCRVLLDDIGSRPFLRSRAARIMRQAGIRVERSLPTSLLWVFFTRLDIRNHRKLVIIDNTIAYSGSQNLADPLYFKASAGVGEWIDIMVRLNGPVVGELKAMFAHDWFQETGDLIPFGEFTIPEASDASCIFGPGSMVRHAPVQLAPSGPGLIPDAIHSLLLTTIYSTRTELIMTTPYFIPDDGVVEALRAAALRGVDVRVIVPVRCDSRLAHHASRARFEELARAGVRICLFAGGLLHAKTICVDRQVALIGSVNLDMRSFWLNFEATLIVYCPAFAKLLAAEQEQYMAQATELDLEAFKQRGWWLQFKENISLLVSPLL